MRENPRRLSPDDRETAVLVAACDSGRARLFRIARNEDRLEEISTLVNPDARLRERELVSDKRGRGMHRGRMSRATLGTRELHRYESAARFSREVAEALSRRSRAEHIERIYLLADPEFLGLLRADIRRKRIKSALREIRKNLSRRSAKILRDYLPKQLWRRPSAAR